MKQLVLALVLALGLPAGAEGKNEIPDYPSSCIVYGFADNGQRYESIIITCHPQEKGIMCSFESKAIRFPNKSNSKNLDQFLQGNEKDKKNAQNEFYQVCLNLEDIIDKSKLTTEYDIEHLEIVQNICSSDKSIEHLFKEIDTLENNVCRITSSTWESIFYKNQDGLWESSNISDFFIGTGIKKATL